MGASQCTSSGDVTIKKNPVVDPMVISSEELGAELEDTDLFKALSNDNAQKVLSEIATESGRYDMLTARLQVSGRFFLHVIAKSKPGSHHAKILHECLQAGADINCKDFAGYTPLSVACLMGHKANVKLFLENGADVNMPNACGETPLHMACYNHQNELVRLLFEWKASAEVMDKNGASLIHFVSALGFEDLIPDLLQHGANINQLDTWFRTPLMVAARNNRVSCVVVLIEHGCGIDDTDDHGCNAARHALMSRCYTPKIRHHHDIISLLVEKGIDIYRTADDGRSVIDLVRERCSVDDVAKMEEIWTKAEKPSGFVLK